MSVERQLQKQIFDLDKQIEVLESKRARSEAYIVDALVTGAEPNAEDVRFFRSYTTDIEEKRARILELQAQLDTLY